MIPRTLLCTALMLLAAAAENNPQNEPQDRPQSQQQARPPGPPATQPDAEDAAQLDLLAIEANIVKYTNAQRAKYGLAALQIDHDLMESAREHASWMALNRKLVHTRQPVAENIAKGQPNSRSAVADWMNSSGHRANILSRGYRLIGVAAYRTPEGTIYWCQQFRR
jgi:uncharacterized protein YkwD